MSALQTDSQSAVPSQEIPESVEELTFRIDGVFDGASAWDLRHAIEQLGPRSVSAVVLDFTRVREFYDFGVAVLAYGLAQRSESLPRIVLRGLRTHQLRMFRYFGVDVDR